MALTDNLVAYWKFDESSGNATDSSGAGLTLTNNNTATYSTGKINNGAYLASSSSQYFSRASFSVANPLTISFWAYESTRVSNADPANTHLLFYSNVNYSEVASNNGVIYFAGNGGSWKSTGYTLPLTTWTHLVFVSSGSTLKMYVNGTLTYTAASDFLVSFANTFYLGAWNGSKGYWNGRMDELGIWSRALSDAEITSLYNSGSGLSYPFGDTPVTFIPKIMMS